MNTISTVSESILIAATLVLLLVVSATIIARSYVLRRRHRALIAEAIANGTFVPPVRVRVGRKPKMYQVSLINEVDEEVVPTGEKAGGRPSLIEKEKRRATVWDGLAVEWNKMMPVSGRLLRPPHPPSDTPSPPSPSPTPPPRSCFWPLRWPGRGHRQPPPPTSAPASSRPSNPQSQPQSPRPSADPRPSSTTMRVLSPDLSEKTARTPTPTAAPNTVPTPADDHVRVAVLISMPFAMSMAAKKASEYGHSAPELPYMEFGVCEVSLERPFDAPANAPLPLSTTDTTTNASAGAQTGTPY
ncbi:hypothetical protein C2E23DRAFT_531814 [Lenzites betulinus]|nr:hypothetical protein C2E23DRAFT_531814 [Lenzites betulinus]